MRTLPLVLAALAAFVSTAWGQEPPGGGPASTVSAVGRKVGDYGDPDCIEFRGLKTFTAEAIRGAVFSDRNVLLAAHPAAPRNEYLAVLRDRMLTGYAHAGFYEATVGAETEPPHLILPSHVILSVREGLRLVRGGVRVVGAKRIPAERLVARLTKPHLPVDMATDPDADDPSGWRAAAPVAPGPPPPMHKLAPKLDPPVWEKGEPAPFDRDSQLELQWQVRDALADLGFHFCKFAAEVVPQPSQKAAELLVRVLDEGPPDTVDEIEISGHHRDKFQEVLDYLHAQPGMRFDQGQRARIERLLWRSGRYIAYKVTPAVHDTGKKLKLQLDLTEYPAAPRLADELSREEKTLLRARQWFTHPDRRRSDLAVSGESGGLRWEVIISPQHGCLALVRAAGKPEGGFLWAVAATDRQIAYYNPSEKRKIVLPLTSARIVMNAQLILDEKGLDGKPFRLLFGMGARSREKDDRGGPVEFNLRVAPAFFVALAHEHEAAGTWKGQRLVLATSCEHIEIDEPTGRLIQWTHLRENQEPLGSLTFFDGGLEKRLREIEELSAAWQNAFDRNRPVGSVVEALWNDSWVWKAYRFGASQNDNYDPKVEQQVRQVGRLLLDHGVFDPLDEWIVRSENKPQATGEEFSIPGVGIENWFSDWQKLWANLPWLGVGWADSLFPRNSWPWTLLRETALSRLGHSKYFPQELQRLAASRDMGPVGFLATARLLRLQGLEGCRDVAAEGLRHLSVADFRRDFRAILPPGRGSTKALYRAAEMLRDWDAREIELVARPLLKQRAALIENLARQLRAQHGKPIAEAIDAILDEYWETTLRAEAEALLREVAR